MVIAGSEEAKQLHYATLVAALNTRITPLYIILQGIINAKVYHYVPTMNVGKRVLYPNKCDSQLFADREH